MRISQASRTIAAMVVVTAGTAPVAATPWTIQGTVTARAGVESNPYLNASSSGTTGLGSLSTNVTASQETARAQTSIIGSAQVGQYISRYGRNTNLLIGASRTQSLSESFTLGGGATFTSTLNPQSNFGFDPTVNTATIDYLTIGTRSQRIDGYLNMDWRATDRDVFRASVSGTRTTYARSLANTNTQYGANFSYLRTIDARTSLGVQLGATQISGSSLPSSQSYQAGLLVVRKISAYWDFDGGISLIRQHTKGFNGSSRLTVGFNGSLCGTYPRSSICLTFSRQSAPSGIGGLRTDTRFAINATHSLTERSRVHAIVSYNLSSGRDFVIVPQQRYYDASLGYNHDVAPRLSVGAEGRYQRRQTSGTSSLFPSGGLSGYSATATATYSFGHRGS